MAEYIDREEAKFHFKTCYPQLGVSIEKAVNEAIDEVPAADVAPVVHAHWYKPYEASQWVCSACGKRLNAPGYVPVHPKDEGWGWCSRCGAKMDEVMSNG